MRLPPGRFGLHKQEESISSIDVPRLGRPRPGGPYANSRDLQDGAPALTPRESEIAGWLTKGKTNWEISVICRVSARTVEKHVERILQKLDVENRTAAVIAIIERRLLL